MKILLCTGIFPPDIGGPATYSKLLKDELPKRGFEVNVLSFGEVRKFPKIIRHIVYFFKVLKRGSGVDVVYAQDPVSVGLPSVLAAKILNKKFIIRVAGDFAWEQGVQRFGVKETIDDFQNKKYGLFVNFFKKIQKFVVDKADTVITPSIYFKNLVSGWCMDPKKVITIYNGIKLIDRSINTKKENMIVTAGRLVSWKGFDVLIELMKDLPEWSLSIVGDGPDHDKLRSLIEENGLSGRVFLKGSISREDLMDLLLRSKLFILNTSFESFSFQVVEAMFAGIPVITTNIGNLKEIIENNKEGILVEPNNKTQILNAIQKINSDENFRREIVVNAKKKSEFFSIEYTVENLINVLINL